MREGKIATMSELQASFEIVLGANNVADPTYNRKALKQLLETEIPGMDGWMDGWMDDLYLKTMKIKAISLWGRV